MSDEEFRDLISENLTCRLSDGEDCSKTMDHFLERCFYVPVRLRPAWGPSVHQTTKWGIVVLVSAHRPLTQGTPQQAR